MGSITDLFGLNGRVALVTGASRGIGCAVARGLAGAGAQVFGLGRSLMGEARASEFAYQTCDITDRAAFSRLVGDIVTKSGRLDILVNAAGISLPLQMSLDPSVAFRQTIETNLIATFDCCNTVIPHMLKGGYGSIINVTSIASAMGFPANSAYVASKGGLDALTRALALDLGTQGVRINNIVPGYIRTQMTMDSYMDPQKRSERVAHTMLGRWGEPDDLVGAAIYLASRASSYVTGSNLTVDGGWSVKGL